MGLQPRPQNCFGLTASGKTRFATHSAYACNRYLAGKCAKHSHIIAMLVTMASEAYMWLSMYRAVGVIHADKLTLRGKVTGGASLAVASSSLGSGAAAVEPGAALLSQSEAATPGGILS